MKQNPKKKQDLNRNKPNQIGIYNNWKAMKVNQDLNYIDQEKTVTIIPQRKHHEIHEEEPYQDHWYLLLT